MHAVLQSAAMRDVLQFVPQLVEKSCTHGKKLFALYYSSTERLIVDDHDTLALSK
jgi:hypothetical protein